MINIQWFILKIHMFKNEQKLIQKDSKTVHTTRLLFTIIQIGNDFGGNVISSQYCRY